MDRTLSGLLKLAEDQVGYLEKKSNNQLDSKTNNAGKNNYTKYGRDMHEIYPTIMDFPASWCDAFVDWCFYMTFGIANAKGLLCGNFDDYTPNSAQLYKNKGAWYTSSPQKGDQIFFNNGKRICHTGLIYKVLGNKVYTIEGNTDDGSSVISNGGAVCKKSYTIRNSRISGYGRPNYAYYELPSYVSSPISTSKKGLCVTASSLNIRKTPDGDKTGNAYKTGKCIQVIAKAFIQNDAWFQVSDKNWVSANYLTGWVKEPGEKWWYLLPKYAWYKDTIQTIDGERYAFANDGYMITGWYDNDGKWMYAHPSGILAKSTWINHTDGKDYYIMKDGYMATNAYIKSTNKVMYYWVNDSGVWEENWNTPTPDLRKYKVVS